MSISSNLGRIDLIVGPMFSGKSEELIRRIKRHSYADRRIVAFKPEIDTRQSDVQSRNGERWESIAVPKSVNILDVLDNKDPNVDVVAIDEAQFFDSVFPLVCERLANRGLIVLVAGLDMDLNSKPFGPIPHLLAIADSVTKLTAVCMVCRKHSANKTLYVGPKIEKNGNVVVGDKEFYKACCRMCYHMNQSTSLPA